MDDAVPIPEKWKPEVLERWNDLKTRYQDWSFAWWVTQGTDDIHFRATHPKASFPAAEILHPFDHDNAERALAKFGGLERQIRENSDALSI